MQINEWDRRLLERHLEFYDDLASGRRTPTTSAQKHFVAVFSGKAKARTQHEIAYRKHLDTKSRGSRSVASSTSKQFKPQDFSRGKKNEEQTSAIEHAEAAIDTIEQI